jgi:hypothetical protein
MNSKNPKYNELGTIDLEIESPLYGWIPFTASPDDVEQFGRDLYAQAIAGAFGPIAPYIPAPPHVNTAVENKAEAERRLAATDWVNQPDVYEPANTPHLTNRDAFLAYRSQVRAIAVNPVSGNLNWPTEPAPVWSQA